MLRSTRRALVTFALLGFFVRALVPVGLMPAPVSAGGPLVFCHGGAAGAFFRVLALQGADHVPVAYGGAHEHHAAVDPMPPPGSHEVGYNAGHHAGYSDLAASTPVEPAATTAPFGTDPTVEHLAWEHCSFSTAFAHAAPAPAFEVPLLALEHTRALPAPRTHSATVTAHRYWARGPPLSTT